MKYFISALFFLSVNSFAQNIDLKRCSADLAGEVPVYSSDFKWNLSLEEIRNLANVMYKSEKRLAKRAYYDESLKSYVFPMDASRGGSVKIPEQFAKTIAKHVEKAFVRGYIDAVLFPDMGHSHFLVPLPFYKKEIDPIPVNQFNTLYEKIMKNKDIKVVYHTAEQLKVIGEDKKLIDNKQLQWRYFTRNLVGHNTPDPDIELVNATATSEANTMGEMMGYYWWGAGFNIHANQNGCFAFKKEGKTMYFDLSLEDLAPVPGSGGDF
ncbi:MAG: hypothetical protein ABL930_11945 [Pseudobdellovibrio sp.]